MLFIVLFIVLFFNNKSLRWMALRRSHFQCGKCEGRRSQSSVARTPSLALPPRWARKEFCVVVCATLLTFVCMLRYSEWNVMPIWFLYSSIFMVVRWAGLLRRRGDYYLGCGRRRYCGRACRLSRRRVLYLAIFVIPFTKVTVVRPVSPAKITGYAGLSPT